MPTTNPRRAAAWPAATQPRLPRLHLGPPPPRLTAEQREQGLLSLPVHERAERAGLRLFVTLEETPLGDRVASSAALYSEGARVFTGHMLEVEQWLTSRGW
jgi:hypothetical protein